MYKLDGSILSIFPVFGEGAMYLQLFDLDVKAFAALTLNAEGYIQVGWDWPDMFLNLKFFHKSGIPYLHFKT